MKQRYEHRRFDYDCFSVCWADPEKDGWELVNVQHVGQNRIFYWKRPLRRTAWLTGAPRTCPRWA